MFSLRPTVLVLALALPGLCLAQSQGAGVTPEGKKGQIYKVQKGDTLWGISQQYLGTPWIWPSVWKENEAEIANPHLIFPGELIWISEGMIRKLTPEEAARLAAAGGESTAAPAAPAPTQEATARRGEEPGEAPDPFASLDAAEVTDEAKVDVPTLQGVSFVTDDDLKAAGAVMGHHDENYWSSQGQRTIVSLGEGQTHVGEAYTIFRVRREVRDPSTNERLGYFVQVLGKADITQVYPETSWARITESWAEIQPGDRIVPFVEEPKAISEVNVGEPVSGKIVALAPYRQRVGDHDFVVLNQGSKGGLVPGRRLVAFRSGREVTDPLTENPLLVPDDIVGELFVVKSSEKTSLALIMRAERDMIVGDSFRNR